MLGGSSLRAPGDAYHDGIAMPTRTRPQPEAQSSDSAQPLPRVDVERFRASLRDGGIEDMLESLLCTFVQDSSLRFAALEQAVQEGNAKAVESAAHAFKSSAGTIRATFLAEGLGEAEAAARAGRLEAATELLERIRNEYRAVLRELEATP
jgi:HPt (histidine-containing phosphotransfer) domain-containing protein